MTQSESDTEYLNVDDDYDDDDDDDQYMYGEDDFSKSDDPKIDPEYLKYEELQLEDVESILNKAVEELSKKLNMSLVVAKLVLISYNWSIDDVLKDFRISSFTTFIRSRILPNCLKLILDAQKQKSEYLWSSYYPCIETVSQNMKFHSLSSASSSNNLQSNNNSVCEICYLNTDSNNRLIGLVCGHQYCQACWFNYFSIHLEQNFENKDLVECMGNQCKLIVMEDMVLEVLSGSKFRDIFLKYQFNIIVESHPQLRFCINNECNIIVYTETPRAKRVKCSKCSAEYCFKCGLAYHAPTSCKTIKQWLLKCRDDWETANYITAYTKDCPACGVCIEKNGGCNHMMCFKCKYNFCWMCLQDWKTHQAEYYECSRYKENPNTAKASEKAMARDSLRKYLFYYERYENHERSLRLEDQQYTEIKTRIDSKVKSMEGTWIDWQYLLDGASTLLRCRYTLKYTYPYAYYMEKSSRKDLFEYQQSILEREVEDLAWKIQNANISDRKQLESKMNQCEMFRKTLIQDFIED